MVWTLKIKGRNLLVLKNVDLKVKNNTRDEEKYLSGKEIHSLRRYKNPKSLSKFQNIWSESDRTTEKLINPQL